MKMTLSIWSRPMFFNALRIALVVGTVLNLINQGYALFGPEAISWPHVVLNYLVPFSVAYYSASRMARQSSNK